MITSIQNPRIKRVYNIQNKHKFRKTENAFVVEGSKMIKEIDISRIEEVYVTDTYLQDNEEWLSAYPYELISEKVFKHLSDEVNPQGILGVIKKSEVSFEDISFEDKPLIVALENLQDPGNLGTIIRTSEAVGASCLLLSKGTVDIYNPKVVRASMGSILRVPIITDVDLEHIVDDMILKGINVYAAHLKESKSPYEYDLTQGTCFLFGNEGNGLSDEIANKATAYIRIPMLGQIESLNVSIAVSVLLYEALRQRL